MVCESSKGKMYKMYNGKMDFYLDWLPRIHHNQQARKYPCGVNDESLTHSVPLRVVIELLGQLRCLHQSCLSSLFCLTCLWYFVPEVHIVTKISPQMTCLKVSVVVFVMKLEVEHKQARGYLTSYNPQLAFVRRLEVIRPDVRALLHQPPPRPAPPKKKQTVNEWMS